MRYLREVFVLDSGECETCEKRSWRVTTNTTVVLQVLSCTCMPHQISRVALNARVCRSLVRWSGKKCTIASGVTHYIFVCYRSSKIIVVRVLCRQLRDTESTARQLDVRRRPTYVIRLYLRLRPEAQLHTVTGFSFCGIGFSKVSMPLSRPSLFLLPLPLSHR